jgi:hypothetical protein
MGGGGGVITHEARIVQLFVAFCPELFELSNTAVQVSDSLQIRRTNEHSG